MRKLFIGTSGWVYPHWKSIFYPDKLPGERKLAFYADRFDTVEVNYSFYSLPEAKTFVRWREQTPADFTFALKASRFLTHVKRLNDPQQPLSLFMERAVGLGEKLGPILFQLPPKWNVDE